MRGFVGFLSVFMAFYSCTSMNFAEGTKFLDMFFHRDF